MATVAVAPALPDIARHFAGGGTGLEVRLLVTAPALSIALAAVPAGLLVDRTGRRVPLIVASVLFAMAGSAGLWIRDLHVLLGSRVLLGVAVAVVMTAATAMIGDFLDGDERERFLGWQSAFMNLGGVLFLGTAGVLATLGWRGPFAIYVVGVLVAALAAGTLPSSDARQIRSLEAMVPPRHAAAGAERAPASLIHGLAAIAFMTFYLVPTEVPFLLQEGGLAPSPRSGAVLATMPLVGAVVALSYPAGRHHLGFAGVLRVSFSVMAIGFASIGFASSWAAIWAGTAVAGLGWGWIMPNLNVWLLSAVTASQRGRTVGRLTAAVFLGQFLSPLAAHLVRTSASDRTPFLVAAGILLLLALTLRPRLPATA